MGRMGLLGLYPRSERRLGAGGIGFARRASPSIPAITLVGETILGPGGDGSISEDGLTWAPFATVYGQDNHQKVAYSPDLGVLLTIGHSTGPANEVYVVRSVDGLEWTDRASLVSSTIHQGRDIHWAPSLSAFVALVNVSSGTRTYRSPTGLFGTWTAGTNFGTFSPTRFAWGDGLGVAVGNGAQRSADGLAWTLSVSEATRVWSDVCYSPELGLWVAVLSSGAGGRVRTSPDGIAWTTRNASDNAAAWFSVCWAAELGLFVAVAVSGANPIMTSPDGITWTGHASPVPKLWTHVFWSPSAGRLIATAEQIPGCIVSANGSTWTDVDPAPGRNLVVAGGVGI